MTWLSRFVFPAACLLLAVIPTAKSANANAKADAEPRELDPGKAYILFQLDPVHRELLGKQIQRVKVTFARYDAQAGRIGSALAKDASFSRDNPIRREAGREFLAKREKQRLFLLELEPDTWTIEAVATQGINHPNSITSFSLGSWFFSAEAGQVLDLGLLMPRIPPSDNPDTKVTFGKVMAMGLLPFGGPKFEPIPYELSIRPREDADIAIPAWLADRELIYPEFTYGNTFANGLGGLVNRIDGREGRDRQKGEVSLLSKPGGHAGKPGIAADEEALASPHAVEQTDDLEPSGEGPISPSE